MKTYIAAFVLFLVSFGSAVAQEPDSILGYWHSPNGRIDIQISKRGNIYSGTTTFIKGEHHTNHHLPSEGTVILSDFKYRGKGVFNRGMVTDIRTGKTYNGQIRLIGNDRLDIRIFFGIIQFGRTETWVRVKP